MGGLFILRSVVARVRTGRAASVLVGFATAAAAVLLTTSLSQLQHSSHVAVDLIEFRATPGDVVVQADATLLSDDAAPLEAAILTGEVAVRELRHHLEVVGGSESAATLASVEASWLNSVELAHEYARSGGDLNQVAAAAVETLTEIDELILLLSDRTEQHLIFIRQLVLAALAAVALGAVALTVSMLRQRRRLSEFDQLTGLPNRNRFLAVLAETLAAGSKYGEAAVAVIDLDRFRRVNESLGEQQGDRVLRDVARRIEGALPVGAVLARRSADEFMLLLPGFGYARGREVGQRILASLEQPFVYESGEVTVGASIGIAVAPVHGRESEVLVRAADHGRDSAKEEGGNTCRVADTAVHQPEGLLQLEVELRHALQHEEFELFYQPQIDIKSGQIVGAEALVRWHSPQRGFVMPEEFISILEQTGLIVPLGEWVVHVAARQALEWSKLDRAPLRIAVNASARQLYHGDLLGAVSEALDETGLSPGCLEVEVTETVAVQNPERTVAILESLRDLGVHVSLDDFGTGHSWLNQLKQLPAMSLKIDRSFIDGIVDQAQDRAIVAGLIAVAHTLDLTVVAEGVEHAAQLAVLEEMECDLVQGFYFSPAVAAAEFERLLTSGPSGMRPREAA